MTEHEPANHAEEVLMYGPFDEENVELRLKLIERFAAFRAEREARERAAEHDADLIPDVSGSTKYQPSEYEAERDRIVRNVDIIEGYMRWCGKSAPRTDRGRRDGIMISCPRPDHPD